MGEPKFRAFFFSVPGGAHLSLTPPKFNEKTPQRKKKGAGRGEKTKFWAPPEERKWERSGGGEVRWRGGPAEAARVSHDSPRAIRAHLKVLALQTRPTFHERTPKRGKKGYCGGRLKKERNVVPSRFKAPPFGPPPFGAHLPSLRAPLFLCLVPTKTHTPDWPNRLAQNGLAQNGLAKIGQERIGQERIGQSRSLPSSAREQTSHSREQSWFPRWPFSLKPFLVQTICCSRASGGRRFRFFLHLCKTVHHAPQRMVFSASLLDGWIPVIRGPRPKSEQRPALARFHSVAQSACRDAASPRQVGQSSSRSSICNVPETRPKLPRPVVRSVPRVVKLEAVLAAPADFSRPQVDDLTAANVAASPPPVDVQLTQCQQFIDPFVKRIEDLDRSREVESIRLQEAWGQLQHLQQEAVARVSVPSPVLTFDVSPEVARLQNMVSCRHSW